MIRSRITGSLYSILFHGFGVRLEKENLVSKIKKIVGRGEMDASINVYHVPMAHRLFEWSP